jgi:LPS-assembly protein
MPANDPPPDSPIQTNSCDFTSLSNPPALAWIALLLSASFAAGAEGLLLKRDEVLSPPEVAAADAPLFFSADRLESVETNVIEASGNVEVRHAGRNLFAQWLRYDMNLNQVEARDDVRLEAALLFVEGDYLRLDLDDYSGTLTHPVYQLRGEPGRGSAEKIDFLDRDRYKLKDARYTTCPIDNDDWFLEVGELEIDRTREVATARKLSLNLLGKPSCMPPGRTSPSAMRASRACFPPPSAPRKAAASKSWSPTTSTSRPITMPRSFPASCRNAASSSVANSGT